MALAGNISDTSLTLGIKAVERLFKPFFSRLTGVDCAADGLGRGHDVAFRAATAGFVANDTPFATFATDARRLADTAAAPDVPTLPDMPKNRGPDQCAPVISCAM